MIKPPSWCSNAVPGKNGWTDPDTGEVYASGRFTQLQIDEFFGKAKEVPAPAPAPIAVATPEEVIEEDLDSMSKAELELLGREHGVELDRRKSKSTLKKTMKSILSK